VDDTRERAAGTWPEAYSCDMGGNDGTVWSDGGFIQTSPTEDPVLSLFDTSHPSHLAEINRRLTWATSVPFKEDAVLHKLWVRLVMDVGVWWMTRLR
jgi:hypothetical protein